MTHEQVEGQVSVQFTWPYQANEVQVYFHEPRSALQLTRGPDGIFAGRVYLPRGTHLYRYFVDGDWEADESKNTVFFQGNNYHVLENDSQPNYDKSQIISPQNFGNPSSHISSHPASSSVPQGLSSQHHFQGAYVPASANNHYMQLEYENPAEYPPAHQYMSPPRSPTASSPSPTPPGLFPSLEIQIPSQAHANSVPSSPPYGQRHLNGATSPTSYQRSLKSKKRGNYRDARAHHPLGNIRQTEISIPELRDEFIKRETEWNAHVYRIKRQQLRQITEVRNEGQKTLKIKERKWHQKKKALDLELKTSKEEISELKAKLEKVESNMALAVTSHERQQNHYENINLLLNEEKTQYEKDNLSLKEQIRILKSKNKDMGENQLNNTKLVVTINNQLESTRRRKVNLEKELKDEKNKREHAEEEIKKKANELKKEKETSKRQIQSSLNKYEDQKNLGRKLHHQIICKEKEINSKSLKIKELNNEITTLKQKQGENDSELLNRAKQDLEAKNKTIHSLEEQKKIGLEKIEKITETIHEKDKKLKDCEIVQEQYEAKLQKLEAQLKDKQTCQLEVQEKLTTLEEEKKKIK